MSALSQRLQDAKGDRSIDDVAREAERQGYRLHRSTVAKFLNGQHGPRTADKTLVALAAGFGLDVRELRLLAGVPAGELGPWTPTEEAARLNREQRRALDELIRTIVRGGSNADAEPGKKSPERHARLERVKATERTTSRPEPPHQTGTGLQSQRADGE